MYSRRKNWAVFRACRYGLKYGYNKIIVTAWVTNHCYLGDQREVDTCSAVYACVQVIQVCLDFSQSEFQIALAFVNLHDLIQSIASSIYFLHSSCLCFELLGFGDFCQLLRVKVLHLLELRFESFRLFYYTLNG
jgi:hypothetical protein